MDFSTVLSKANDLLKYPQRRRRRRLYRQWVERADLPPEAVPEGEVARDIIPKIDKDKLRLNVLNPNILYILLGASVMIFVVGLILLAIHSC